MLFDENPDPSFLDPSGIIAAVDGAPERELAPEALSLPDGEELFH